MDRRLRTGGDMTPQGFTPKLRTQPISYDKPPWHPEGDCHCAKPMHTGRWYGGSESCDRCGHLIGRGRWEGPPLVLYGRRQGDIGKGPAH